MTEAETTNRVKAVLSARSMTLGKATVQMGISSNIRRALSEVAAPSCGGRGLFARLLLLKLKTAPVTARMRGSGAPGRFLACGRSAQSNSYLQELGEAELGRHRGGLAATKCLFVNSRGTAGRHAASLLPEIISGCDFKAGVGGRFKVAPPGVPERQELNLKLDRGCRPISGLKSICAAARCWADSVFRIIVRRRGSRQRR